MKLGKILGTPEGGDMVLPWKVRRRTHMHVVGAPGYGKSKFLEWMIRGDIDDGRGFCLIDAHGTLYRDILAWLAYRRPDREVILLNLSDPAFVTGFNPFHGEGPLEGRVSSHIDATIKPWGMKNTDETPNLERIARIFFHFVAVSGESVANASLLLRYPKRELREYAIRITEDSWVREQWRELQHVKSLREWREQVLSVNNRLGRFVGSDAVKRFTGLRTGNLDLRYVLDSGAILLVNLGKSDYLPTAAGRVFGALLLNQFFAEAMRRADTNPDTYTLYLDEFQKFVTDDMIDSLDEARKGGLHLVLAHQRLGQLLRHPEAKDAITTDAKVKVVFGGLPAASAKELAEELFLRDINEPQVLDKMYRTATVGHDVVELRSGSKTRSHASGSSDGHFNSENGELHAHGSNDGHSSSESSSETDAWSQALRPRLEKEHASTTYFGREDKVGRKAHDLMALPHRHCIVKIPGEPVRHVQVRQVEACDIGREEIRAYELDLYAKQGARPAAEVDASLKESEQAFLRRAKESSLEPPGEPLRIPRRKART